jgi:microcystin-dependent protein
MVQDPRQIIIRRDAFEEGPLGDRMYFELANAFDKVNALKVVANVESLQSAIDTNTADIATNASDISDNASAIAAFGSAVPVGSIIAYGGSSAPTGWFECDGVAISRTTYEALYTAIGTNYGYGDGSTTFNIPDLRGKFPRGYDHGAGNDPDVSSRTAQATGGNTGDNVGSVQDSAMQRITGDADTAGNIGFFQSGGTENGVFKKGTTKGNAITNTPASADLLAFDSSLSSSPNTAKTSDYETRPINVSVMFIIKYQ